MKPWGIGVLVFLAAIFLPNAIAGNVNIYSYASGNVSTSAYTVVWSSTPTSAGNLQICDTSGQLVKVAIGNSGQETDIATVQISGCVVIPIYLAQGSKISLKAVNASATTGYNTIALL